MKKKSLGVFALICMLVMATGCGEKQQETVSQKQNKDYVYTFENMGETFEGRDISQSLVTKDRIILTEFRYEDILQDVAADKEEAGKSSDGEAYEEEIEVEFEAEEAVTTDMGAELPVEEAYEEAYENYISKCYMDIWEYDLEGTLLNTFTFEMPQESGINGIAADAEGNIYCVLVEYGKDTSDPEWVKDVFTLLSFSAEGEERSRLTLTPQITEDEYYYVDRMFYNSKDQLLLVTTVGIEVYQKDFTPVKTIPFESDTTGTVILLKNGLLAIQCYGDSNIYFRTLDVETGEYSERQEVAFNGYMYSFYAGTEADFIVVDSMGVYSYNLGDEALQKKMDFVDSDMTSNTCYSVSQVSEDSFFAIVYDEVKDEDLFGRFTKVDPKDVPDKKTMTLGTMYLDSEIRKRVVEFNKSNGEYRIRVEDYSQYNTEEDYTVGTTKMNTDIASGKVPDLLCITQDMPVKSYMSKGLFADIKDFVEQDEELHMEDFMPELVEAYSYDGKWYQLVPSFDLFTVVGKTADVGKTPGWTFADMQEVRNQKESDVEVFSEQTKSSILGYNMMLNGDTYINWETGECYFDTPEFIQLLEFANEFPEEINYEDLFDQPEYWETRDTIFRDGRALLQIYTFGTFDAFSYTEQGSFGEPITAIGFPVKEGVGNAYSANMNFAISARSEYKDAAWEFLRYYLTAEYQDALSYGFPIRIDSLEKKAQEAQEPLTYEDENGNLVEYEDTYYIGNIEVSIKPLTQQDCDRIIGYIKSADHVYSYNQNIMNIMEEECAAYFKGQKSAEEVAQILQSRIRIYVNELL